jgi:hypothetical protein
MELAEQLGVAVDQLPVGRARCRRPHRLDVAAALVGLAGGQFPL